MPSTLTRSGDVTVLTLDEGRGNALSFATIEVLERLLTDVEQRFPYQPLVITGTGKIFSAGLDLRACARFHRAEMARYVDAFENLFDRIFSFPAPVVAALNGSAIAGGAVIALACDVRVMARTAQLALNEVELGLPFPSMAFEIGRFGYPATVHVDGLMLGKRFTAEEAAARGFAHISDDVAADALAQAHAFTARGLTAVATVKQMLRAEALERARQHAVASRKRFLDQFFSDDTQARIGALVAKLESR